MSGKVLLADENIALGAIDALRKAGYQVIAIAEESPGLSDAAVLARACALGAILLTFDRDYGELIFKDGHPYPRCDFPSVVSQVVRRNVSCHRSAARWERP